MRAAIPLLFFVAAPVAAQNADLSVTVTAPAAQTASELGQTPIHITVTNNGPSTASNVVLTETLSVPVPLSGRLHGAGGGAFCAPENDPGVCTVGTLASGESEMFDSTPIFGWVTQQTVMNINESVTSSIPDPNSANNAVNATTTINQPAIDLYFAFAGTDQTSVAPLDLVTYTFRTRYGFPDTIPPSVITVTLPPGATFVSASGGCSGTTTITCDVSSWYLELYREISVTVHAPHTLGPATATATLSSPYLVDANATNNSISASVNVAAPVPALSPAALLLLALALVLYAISALRSVP